MVGEKIPKVSVSVKECERIANDIVKLCSMDKCANFNTRVRQGE
jgi:hypothetical protein